MKPAFTLGAFAIIPNEDNCVLLCHRRDLDVWNLPGGVVEHGESPWHAVVREVEEETGLVVAVRRLLGVYSKPDRNEVVFSFECIILDGEITLTDEADRIEYFALDFLPGTLLKKQRQRILDWNSANTMTCLKEQHSNGNTTIACTEVENPQS